MKKILSVIILTHNESENLPICLDSFENLDVDIFIVDSGSSDDTLEIARAAGCNVYEHSWTNYATQFNWALNNLPIETPWTMRMDADERLTNELHDELGQRLVQVTDDVGGFMVKRRVYFWGRWIRNGSYYPTWLLRIWRTGKARCEERWMDEHMELLEGDIVQLEHDIIDENHKGLTFWIDKHNHYADREVMDLLAMEEAHADASLNGQAGRKRWIKENLYSRSPLFIRALAYWSYRYFIRLGILDGLPGMVFHFLQGFWYRFLVDAKIYELRLKKRQ